MGYHLGHLDSLLVSLHPKHNQTQTEVSLTNHSVSYGASFVGGQTNEDYSEAVFRIP